MKIEIEATDQIVNMGGTLCRMWTGTTDKGTPCLVFVSCVAIPADSPEDLVSKFQAELKELPAPTDPNLKPGPTEAQVKIDPQSQYRWN